MRKKVGKLALLLTAVVFLGVSGCGTGSWEPVGAEAGPGAKIEAKKESGEKEDVQEAGNSGGDKESLPGAENGEPLEERPHVVMSTEKAAAPEEETPGEPSRTTLVFAGDILFDDRYAVMAGMKARGGGIEGAISSDLLSVMREADIFMVNNEFPYTDRGTPVPGKTYTFRAKPEYVSYLKDMGVDIVSLANNHAYDYGEVSLTDSMDALSEAGIPYVGAGHNLSEAVQPVVFEINGVSIAVLSATQIERTANPESKGATETSPGVFRCMDPERLVGELRKADEEYDFVVLYVHWGTESIETPDHWQTEQAPLYADAGADLIIGDHPHVLQPITYAVQTPVVYSLGNFLFNSKTRDTCLVRATLLGTELESLQFIPAVQENSRVHGVSGAEAERILSYMRKISPQAFIDENGYVTKP